MADTTLTQVTPAINNFYDRNMLKAARPLLVHTRWGQTKDIPTKNGQVIKFRRYSLLSAATTALSEGVTPTGSQLSVTDVTATVSFYGDYVTLTDELLLTSYDPLLTETSDVLGQQAGNTIDQLCRDVIQAGTTVQYATGVAARTDINASMKITKSEVQKAVRTLKGNDARRVMTMVSASDGFNTSPINATYIGIVHPNTTFDLKNITGFVPVEEYGNKSDVMEGEVGALDEVRFVETTNAKTFSSTVTVYGTLIIAQNAYANTRIAGNALKNIVKPLGSAGSADPLDQRQTSGWKASYVAKILNENFILRLEHSVTA